MDADFLVDSTEEPTLPPSHFRVIDGEVLDDCPVARALIEAAALVGYSKG